MKYKIALLLIIISFVLNYLWEFVHAYYLYDIYKYDINYFLLIFYASFVDMILIFLIFWFGGLVFKDFFWITSLDKIKYIYILLVGTIISVFIEIKGVYIFKQWSYSELMPKLFGIGVSPLLQLTITSIVGYYLTRIVYKKI